MKNIELTEDHKSKLLEMCKKLFPEYEISVNHVGEGYINHVIFYEAHDQMYKPIQHYPPGKPFPKRLFKIHWFEFCMTHLKDKLQDKLEKVSKLDYDYQMKAYDSWWESHPIDYLYEEFKKS